MALAVLLAACSHQNQGEVGFVEGFYGGVVADEPRAALLGRDALSAGGSAADAATAMYFALSATLPSAAGIGGGGVCLVHDAKTKKTQALDFISVPPAKPGGERPVAVPGNPRGFFALHAKYGRLRWETLVAPGENLARFGHPISRAFAADLASIGNAVLVDPGMREVFAGKDGKLLGEGAKVLEVDLAATLGNLRAKGPGDFYSGRMAARVVEAYRAAGGAIDINDLRSFTPTWRDTVKRDRSNETVHFTPVPAGGAVAAAMWPTLSDGGAKPDMLSAAGMRGFADAKAAGVMGNPSATSFVAVDRDGSAVACAVTLNAPFGTGRVAPGTGIIPAALPGPGGRGADALSVMMVINSHVNEFYYASGASGGVAAPTAMMNVAARTLIDGALLNDAIAAPRVHHGGVPNRAYYEQALDAASARMLGADAQAVLSLGRVNAISCPKGIPPHPANCAALADPRGAGLGLMSGDN